jgi:hypothetical protein
VARVEEMRNTYRIFDETLHKKQNKKQKQNGGGRIIGMLR